MGNHSLDGDDQLVPLGQVTKSQGLKGAFRVRAFSVESESLPSIKTLYLESPQGSPQLIHVRKVECRKGFFVFHTQELTHVDQVAPIIGKRVFADKQDLVALDEDDYYWFQLVDLEVETTTGTRLGTVKSILATGANDVLVVNKGDDEFLIPFIDDVIISINLEKKLITIEPIPGLLD